MDQPSMILMKHLSRTPMYELFLPTDCKKTHYRLKNSTRVLQF